LPGRATPSTVPSTVPWYTHRVASTGRRTGRHERANPPGAHLPPGRPVYRAVQPHPLPGPAGNESVNRCPAPFNPEGRRVPRWAQPQPPNRVSAVEEHGHEPHRSHPAPSPTRRPGGTDRQHHAAAPLHPHQHPRTRTTPSGRTGDATGGTTTIHPTRRSCAAAATTAAPHDRGPAHEHRRQDPRGDPGRCRTPRRRRPAAVAGDTGTTRRAAVHHHLPARHAHHAGVAARRVRRGGHAQQGRDRSPVAPPCWFPGPRGPRRVGRPGRCAVAG